MNRGQFLSLTSREQKKDALSHPSVNNLSMIVCTMASFPVPASPFS